MAVEDERGYRNWKLMQAIVDARVFRGTQLLVAIVMGSHQQRQGIFVKHSTIADACGCDVATVKRAIAKLLKTPYVRQTKPAAQHRPATYEITLPPTNVKKFRSRQVAQSALSEVAQSALSEVAQSALSQVAQSDRQVAQSDRQVAQSDRQVAQSDRPIRKEEISEEISEEKRTPRARVDSWGLSTEQLFRLSDDELYSAMLKHHLGDTQKARNDFRFVRGREALVG
jgi:hypothetical protein